MALAPSPASSLPFSCRHFALDHAASRWPRLSVESHELLVRNAPDASPKTQAQLKTRAREIFDRPGDESSGLNFDVGRAADLLLPLERETASCGELGKWSRRSSDRHGLPARCTSGR